MMIASRPTTVLKFGGTSVGSGTRLVEVASIVKAANVQHKPIVVLSAMSSKTKSLGTTSRLLDAVQEILVQDSRKYLDIVDEIESKHIAAGRDAIPQETTIRIILENDIKRECEKLRSFMAAAEIIDEISLKSKDIIVSMGEKLSARLFTAVLESQGVAAKYVPLDKVILKKFEKEDLDQTFYNYISTRLCEVVSPWMETHVCVLTGFFGPCPGSLLDTVGRGYTDLSAALVAVGVGAEELQIWKEVDGIFTADPRKVPKAKKLHSITPEEAAELTYYGSEVIHPFTMEQVIRASIPIRIKNTFNPDGEGTLIMPDDGEPTSPSQKHPTAVTLKDSVVVLNVLSNRRTNSHGFLAQTFLILDKYGIVVDLISTSEVHVSMALGPDIKEVRLEQAVKDISKYGEVTVLKDQAILSLVGKEMRNMVGVCSKLFASLANVGVNIEMISQGASEINISCVINSSMGEKGLQAVHDDLIS